ncbi:hypothetical protein PYCCODRAFT_1482032 [Trametes coccinea BRFM310]|uniref:Uncharacterized protein n=1 Tax=Trametes coccinea (strain BRFM310) TaxID=1353009 RepID=A0A1Y2I4S7_TRAC3|nr:hypothetical protein PYCCODRAFT_1482032 [Trametes coccinea BRFM310]
MPRRTAFPSPEPASPSPSKTAGSVPGAAHNSSGSASIVGTAVLENARLSDSAKPRTITFDASFWTGEATMPLTACFRYFNRDNIEIPEQGTFALLAMVAQPTKDADLSSTAAHTDYDLIGDIIWMVHVPGANAHQYPVMIVNGPVRETEREAATFKVSAMQFVQQLRDSNPGVTNIHVTIPDTGRFKNGKKPLPPSDGFNAAVVGTLAAIDRDPETMAGQMFRLTLENVTYLPRLNSSLPVHTPATPQKGSKRKMVFQDTQESNPGNPGKRRAVTEESTEK